VSDLGPFDAVIFDLDGVLVDSEIWWDEARASFAARHDRPWSVEDRLSVMGANSATWSRTMRERLGLEMDPSAIEAAVVGMMVDRYRRDGPPVIEGAVDAVRRIAGRLPVAIASSAHPDVIQAALEGTGLGDVFGAVASSDEVAIGKPEPDVYLLAAQRLGVDPRRCLVVEDSLNGLRAARAAGMRTALVPNQSIPPAEGAMDLADVTFARLADLETVVFGRRGAVGAEPANGAPSSAAPAGTEMARAARAPRTGGSGASASSRQGSETASRRRAVRYVLARLAAMLAVRLYLRMRVEHRERFASGPAVYCFNHLSWLDPFVLMAALPLRPRLYFFGPKEEDMQVGGRNRVIAWTGTAVPYKPGKNDLLGATRRVEAVFAAGGVLAIAGEGRIHVGESEIHPLSDGPAYFALRARVPLVPVAINGTSWVAFRRTVRIRVGQPIVAAERPTTQSVGTLTQRLQTALEALVADAPDPSPPGRVGRWLSERFNDWGPDGRPEIPLRPPDRGGDQRLDRGPW
jgi:HAD superfamily hydrolase (TIGR01509 family)